QGSYDLRMAYKSDTKRGILKASVNDVEISSSFDQFAPTQGISEIDFGTVSFTDSGDQTVRLTVTGKNPKASTFYISADKFKLIPQIRRYVFEAEDLETLAHDGGAELQVDTNSSGGFWVGLTN